MEFVIAERRAAIIAQQRGKEGGGEETSVKTIESTCAQGFRVKKKKAISRSSNFSLVNARQNVCVFLAVTFSLLF